MASGKLALLLVAGGLAAGMGLAGMTTHGMRSFQRSAAADVTAPHEQTVAGYAAGEPNARSWLEERFAELDVPAWPFGRSQWQDNSAVPNQLRGYARPDGYEGQAPYGYRRDGDDPDAGLYEDDRYADGPYGREGEGNYADDGAHEPDLPGTAADPAAPLGNPHARRNDTAAEAAARASAAAQDVAAAERSGT